jgi:probable phosphoglycerate mutase
MLSDVRFDAIYSSPVQRCRETADIVAAPHGIRVREDERIQEVDYGKWSNRTFGSLRKTKLWDVVQRQPSAARFPEGESIREVQARAVDAVQELAARHPKKKICCVSHADVIKLVLAHFLGVHIDLYQRIAISPASVSGITLGGPIPMVWGTNHMPVSASRSEGS